MCIIFVSHAQHARYKLILAANREEIFSRGTAALSRWTDQPDILAGRDLLAQGTWMGVNVKTGRWAGLTNVPDPTKPRKVPGEGKSRGEIVERWLRYPETAEAPDNFLEDMRKDGDEYDGFNVLFGDISEEPSSLHFFTNKTNGREPETLKSGGLYGVSNATLETPWPKLVHGKQAMGELIARVPQTEVSAEDEQQLVDGLLNMLRDESGHEDAGNSYNGTGTRRLFYYLDSIDYGTRASTVILARQDGSVRVVERSFDNTGAEIARKDVSVHLGKM